LKVTDAAGSTAGVLAPDIGRASTLFSLMQTGRSVQEATSERPRERSNWERMSAAQGWQMPWLVLPASEGAQTLAPRSAPHQAHTTGISDAPMPSDSRQGGIMLLSSV
jgi:hypothetical protein